MREYVLVYCEQDDHILLVLKDRPDWQRNKLNLPGGKIDEEDREGTTLATQYACKAAIRELKEETGLDGEPIKVYGKMIDEGPDKGSIIYCVGVQIEDFRQPLHPRPGETEIADWYLWHQIYTNPRLIPNLRVIIPLCFAGVEGWVINDDAEFSGKSLHEIRVQIPTWN